MYIIPIIAASHSHSTFFLLCLAKNDDFTISAAVFVGVVAGLVLIIFLMFIAALCVFGSMKRRKASLDGERQMIVKCGKWYLWRLSCSHSAKKIFMLNYHILNTVEPLLMDTLK